MVLVASSVDTAFPAARYTSYDAAPAEAGQLSLADVCDGNTEPFTGDILVTQACAGFTVMVIEEYAVTPLLSFTCNPYT